MSHVIAVEFFDGTHTVVGPFDAEGEAQLLANRIRATYRLASWRAGGCVGHPDDEEIHAFVVPLVPAAEFDITDNPFDNEDMEIVEALDWIETGTDLTALRERR